MASRCAWSAVKIARFSVSVPGPRPPVDVERDSRLVLRDAVEVLESPYPGTRRDPGVLRRRNIRVEARALLRQVRQRRPEALAEVVSLGKVAPGVARLAPLDARTDDFGQEWRGADSPMRTASTLTR